jgi:hypothetical protein
MPYIRKIDRDMFKSVQLPFKIQADLNRLNAGQLNYIITWIIDRQLTNANYARYNEIIGALECCKLELYRRMIVPYENKKIKENGDVYTQNSDN